MKLPEIAVVGELTENESTVTSALLEVPAGGKCLMYFNCPGGSAYTALAISSLITLRGVRATGVVTGECSSAALWVFAACIRRIVTEQSVALFHPMKWQSEEHVGIAEAAEWSRHFQELESSMDTMLAERFGVSAQVIHDWTRPGRYVSGKELAEKGVAELVPLRSLEILRSKSAKRRKESGSR